MSGPAGIEASTRREASICRTHILRGSFRPIPAPSRRAFRRSGGLSLTRREMVGIFRHGYAMPGNYRKG